MFFITIYMVAYPFVAAFCIMPGIITFQLEVQGPSHKCVIAFKFKWKLEGQSYSSPASISIIGPVIIPTHGHIYGTEAKCIGWEHCFMVILYSGAIFLYTKQNNHGREEVLTLYDSSPSFRTDKSKQDWKLELKISRKVPKIHIRSPVITLTWPIWRGRCAATLRNPFSFLARTWENFPVMLC